MAQRSRFRNVPTSALLTKVVEVIEFLIGKGYAIQICDHNASMSKLVGATKRFIEEHIPRLSCHPSPDIEALLPSPEHA
jgi:GDP-mannose 6-dehydrogenase